jgi:hypothetical protein
MHAVGPGFAPACRRERFVADPRVGPTTSVGIKEQAIKSLTAFRIILPSRAQSSTVVAQRSTVRSRVLGVFAMIKRLPGCPDYEWVEEFPRSRSVVETEVTARGASRIPRLKLLILSVVRVVIPSPQAGASANSATSSREGVLTLQLWFVSRRPPTVRRACRRCTRYFFAGAGLAGADLTGACSSTEPEEDLDA